MRPYYDDGKRVIYHGDAREIMPALTWDVLISDVPYGVALRSGRGGSFGECSIAGDIDTEARDAVLALASGKPAAVFGTWRIPRPAGVRCLLTWDKGEHVGMGDLSLPWKPNTEEIYIFGEGWHGHRKGSVLRHHAIAGTVAVSKGRHHPMEKPVGLMADLIGCAPPGVVIDPFMGSGTTLRAAADMGRKAIGIEIDERYCEIAAKRLAQISLYDIEPRP